MVPFNDVFSEPVLSNFIKSPVDLCPWLLHTFALVSMLHYSRRRIFQDGDLPTESLVHYRGVGTTKSGQSAW